MALLSPPRHTHGSTPPPTVSRHPRSRLLAISVLLGVLAGVATTLTVPTARLGAARTGDPALAADVEAAMPHHRLVAPDDAGFVSLSVGRIADGHTMYAGLGADPPSPDTIFELGSITKTFTGLLLADAVERGEMSLDDPISTYLPELADTPAGGSTLHQLATHTSGLPSLPPMGPAPTWRALTGGNPYQGWDASRVITAAAKTKVGTRGHYAYSNLGVALLGLAEARAAHEPDWPTLAHERLLRPLGMTHTTFVADDATTDPVRTPHRTNGWPVDPWSGPGFVAAGVATRTTAGDLMRYAQALLDGTAPGLAALTPTTDIGHGERIGLVWMTTRIDGHQVVWHNGGTGGSRTMIALDRQTHRAVVVLGNSARPVDLLALRALLPHQHSLVSSPTLPISALVFGGVALLLVVELAVAAFRVGSRLQVASKLLTGGFGAVLGLVYGPWGYLPAWVFGLLVGVAVAAAAVAVVRAVRLPTRPEANVIRTVIGMAFSLVLVVAVLLTM